MPEGDQPVGLGQGQRAQQYRIDHAEDRRARPDTQPERQPRDGGKDGILAQHPRAVAQVLPEVFEEPYPPGVTAILSRLLNTAEITQRRQARLFRAHARADVYLDLALQVVTQLLIEFTVKPPPEQ